MLLFLPLMACGPSVTGYSLTGLVALTTVPNAEAAGIAGAGANETSLFVFTHDGWLFSLDAAHGQYPAVDAATAASTAIGQLKGNLLQGIRGRVQLGDSRSFGAMTVTNTRAYVVLAGGTLKTVDISDPSNLKPLADIAALPGTTQALLIGKRLLLNNGPRSMLLDVSVDPPTVAVAEAALAFNAAFAGTNDTIYTVDNSLQKISTWRIESDKAPSPQGVPFQALDAMGVAQKITALHVRGQRLFAAGPGMLQVFDISSPEAPKAIGVPAGHSGHSTSYPYGEGSQAMAMITDTLVLAPGALVPTLWDVSNPSTPLGTPLTGLSTDVEYERLQYAVGTPRGFLVGSTLKAATFAAH